MKQTGFYGENARQFCRLEQEPSSLITRSLRNTEIAITETRDDAPPRSLSGGMPLEDSFVVSLKLNDYPSCELWAHGKCVTKADIRAGATYLYDMKTDLRFVINNPFHTLHFYLPRSALDGIAEQFRAPRVGELPCELGVGHDDPVIRHTGGALQQALRRPAEFEPALYRLHDARSHRARRPDLWRVANHPHAGPRRSRPMAGETSL